MKKIFTGIIIGIILAVSFQTMANVGFNKNNVIDASNNWTIYYNGENIDMNDPTQNGEYMLLNYNNRLYSPIRLITEISGFDSESMWLKDRPGEINLNKEDNTYRNTQLMKLEEHITRLIPKNEPPYIYMESMNLIIEDNVLKVFIFTSKDYHNEKVETYTKQTAQDLVARHYYDLEIGEVVVDAITE